MFQKLIAFARRHNLLSPQTISTATVLLVFGVIHLSVMFWRMFGPLGGILTIVIALIFIIVTFCVAGLAVGVLQPKWRRIQQQLQEERLQQMKQDYLRRLGDGK